MIRAADPDLLSVDELNTQIERYKHRMVETQEEMLDEMFLLTHLLIQTHEVCHELEELGAKLAGPEDIGLGPNYWGALHQSLGRYFEAKGYYAPFYSGRIATAVIRYFAGSVSSDRSSLMEFWPNKRIRYIFDEPKKLTPMHSNREDI